MHGFIFTKTGAVQIFGTVSAQNIEHNEYEKKQQTAQHSPKSQVTYLDGIRRKMRF
jgi:hypothetical protein